MWEALGFTKDPYDASPLEPKPGDVDLLIGRQQQGVAFCSTLDSSNRGMLVISGVPGVGKTSFFNIYQYLLESQNTFFGPKLLADRVRCHVQPYDEPRSIALRSLQTLCRSVEEYCRLNGHSNLPQNKKILDWLSAQGKSGYTLGINLLGVGGSFGRTVSVPSVSDVSFEGIADLIVAVKNEAMQNLEVSGVQIALDNIENLGDQNIAPILMTFRDTLFSIDNVWWILIGQSGFGSFLQTQDSRVSDKLGGQPIELSPISFEELDKAISKRVERFHSSAKGKSPLPSCIHKLLYDASHGEIRFVFKYSSIICQKVISRVRDSVIRELKPEEMHMSQEEFNGRVDSEIGHMLVEEQIPSDLAKEVLKETIRSEVEGLGLRNKERRILKQIGSEGGARPKDFKNFGLETLQDFSSNYLSKFHKQDLLARRQEGRSVVYTLRGVVALASEFGLLEEHSSGNSS